MFENDFIGNRQQVPVRTDSALDPGFAVALGADTFDPFVGAGGLVAASAGF